MTWSPTDVGGIGVEGKSVWGCLQINIETKYIGVQLRQKRVHFTWLTIKLHLLVTQFLQIENKSKNKANFLVY